MNERKFQRRVEDFTCSHCGANVSGNGYTNHCPVCLYSKHVDIHPGDRANNCGGMMQPVGLEQKGDNWIIIHQCEKCGGQMKCRTSPEDMPGVLVLAKKLAERISR
jgi:hypothetical protein